jgi:hypothetical protein
VIASVLTNPVWTPVGAAALWIVLFVAFAAIVLSGWWR